MLLIQAEKAFSEEASSLLNSAYSTLKSPLDRAIYLVRSAALPKSLLMCIMAPLCYHAGADCSIGLSKISCMQLGRRGIGADEEKEGIDDPAFLMEVMEVREEIEDLDNPEALQSLKSQYIDKQRAIIQVCRTSGHSRQMCHATVYSKKTIAVSSKDGRIKPDPMHALLVIECICAYSRRIMKGGVQAL